jgi:formimidoylglutamate deiminase
VELERLRAAQAVAGLCPTTEANLGDGIFPFEAHARAGGRWGIGGDSHVGVSPFEELRALEYSQRLALRIRNVASSASAPEVATNLWAAAASGGAQALGQPVGALAAGKRADLVVLDGTDLDFEALEAPGRLAVAVFSGSRNRVRDVYVAGRAVVTQGAHPARAEVAATYLETLRRLRRV